MIYYKVCNSDLESNTNKFNRSFPSWFLPRYQSEAGCKGFHTEMHFICERIKPNFYIKSCAPSLAVITYISALKLTTTL